jgi:hypothetical protein
MENPGGGKHPPTGKRKIPAVEGIRRRENGKSRRWKASADGKTKNSSGGRHPSTGKRKTPPVEDIHRQEPGGTSGFTSAKAGTRPRASGNRRRSAHPRLYLVENPACLFLPIVATHMRLQMARDVIESRGKDTN